MERVEQAQDKGGASPFIVIRSAGTYLKVGLPHIRTTVQAGDIIDSALNVDVVAKRTGLSKALHTHTTIHTHQHTIHTTSAHNTHHSTQYTPH